MEAWYRGKVSVLACAWCLCLAVPCCNGSARAACSRPISAIYSSTRVAESYGSPPTGALPPLHEAIARDSGCVVRIASEPPARAVGEFEEGRADLLIGSSSFQSLASNNRFIPIIQSPWLLLTPANARGLPDRLEAFVGMRGLLIGRVRGGSYPADVQAIFNALAEHHQIDEAVDTDMALNKLLAGRDSATLVSAAAFIVQPDRIRNGPLRRAIQTQLAPAVFGIFLNHKTLTDGDQKTLATAITALVARDLPVGLMRQHAPAEAASLLQSPH